MKRPQRAQLVARAATSELSPTDQRVHDALLKAGDSVDSIRQVLSPQFIDLVGQNVVAQREHAAKLDAALGPADVARLAGVHVGDGGVWGESNKTACNKAIGHALSALA